MKTLLAAVLSVTTLFFTTNLLAAEQHEIQGVVKEIKTGDKKITISHGPIVSMGMDGMTMDFGVFDPAMLDEVSKGHKISALFEVDKKGNFVIVELEDQGMSSDAMSSEGHKDDGHSH